MLPMQCVTCGTLFADKIIPYELELKEIGCDIKLSDIEKSIKRKELLDKLGITQYCCRMRFLTYIDKIDILN